MLVINLQASISLLGFFLSFHSLYTCLFAFYCSRPAPLFNSSLLRPLPSPYITPHKFPFMPSPQHSRVTALLPLSLCSLAFHISSYIFFICCLPSAWRMEVYALYCIMFLSRPANSLPFLLYIGFSCFSFQPILQQSWKQTWVWSKSSLATWRSAAPMLWCH